MNNIVTNKNILVTLYNDVCQSKSNARRIVENKFQELQNMTK
jgi:hypothetical protein